MKLNIITAGANSVGYAILQKVITKNDLSIALSRRGTNFENAENIQISDLINTEEVKSALLKVFSTINEKNIEEIKLFHNCCYVVCEVPNLETDYPEYANNPKFRLKDEDGDGIDDRTYHSLLTTFDNVLSPVRSYYPETKLSIGIICSLTDKKSYVPTVFQSMVKTNHILRKQVEDFVMNQKNVQGVCISASTVRTETEDNFRKYCEDKEYRVSAEMVAESLVTGMVEHRNTYKDIDLYVYNPRYEEYYKNETDEQMTERLKREIGVTK